MTDLALLKSIFADKGVTRALLVDDAFDPSPEFDSEALARAFALFEARDDVEAAFVEIGGTRPANPDALRLQLVGTEGLEVSLKEGLLLTDSPGLRDLARAVFGDAADDKAGQLKPLEDLKRLLEDLGVEAVQVGSTAPVAAADKFPLIFLDYYLGPKGAPSVEKSRDRVMEIVNHYGPDEKPIVILMSSDLAKEKTALEFRDKAELLGCQFKFVAKSKFGASEGLSFVSTLADLVEFLDQSRLIGGYVFAWNKALGTSVAEFKKEIIRLDLHDYFQIHAKAGPTAARHFGDHITSLFDGYLLKLVEERPELRSATAALNGVKFENKPPVPFAPSAIVSTMAHAVSFQQLPASPGGASDNPDLELGDVFYREVGSARNRVTEVCAVISQACDLDREKTKTILLIKGSVSRLSSKRVAQAAENRPILRTDLFQHDGDDLLIDWDASDLETAPWDGFETWRQNMGYEKAARLRPLQALALQQLFATHLSRVGLPDMPPHYRFPNLEVTIRRENKAVRLFDPLPSRTKSACVISDGPAHCVLLEAVLERITVELDKLQNVKEDEVPKIAAALATLNDLAKFRELRNTQLKEGKAQVDTILVWDREAAYSSANEGQPAGTWLTIALYPGVA